jgi:hypothetical protein
MNRTAVLVHADCHIQHCHLESIHALSKFTSLTLITLELRHSNELLLAPVSAHVAVIICIGQGFQILCTP